MSDRIFVKPAAPDLRVRDPDTGRHLPAEGAHVPRSQYWLRRLAAGDAVEAAPPAPALPQEA